MKILHRVDGDVHVLSIDGRVTIEDADEFDAYLAHLLAQGARNVVFDCAGITHIVSATVGSLLGVRQRVHDGGGHACIANLSVPMQRIAEQMDLTRFLDVHPDTASAIKALAGS
jgi:anti-anti-sigma factor